MRWSKLGEFLVEQTVTCQFAQASGDYNPLHVDPVQARRNQFGATVMHGVYGVAKALDILLEHLSNTASISSIKVQFTRPVLHGDRVEVYSQQLSPEKLKLRLSVQKKRVQDIDLVLMNVNSTLHAIVECQSVPASKSQPVDLQFEEANALQGEFEPVWVPDLVQSLFPNIKEYLPDNQIAVLMGLTQIVGMRCPGLHSVFAGLTLDFIQNPSVCNRSMQFEVLRSDPRFSMVTISVAHSTANGEITALFRPKPVSQESFTALQALVQKNQFQGQRALVIGGSRGIGEVTAKLIAAGGGYPTITYYQGKDDAQRVVDEIRTHGGHCDAVFYNALADIHTDITDCIASERISHIYYFASPLISKGDQAVWDDAVFQQFSRYYLQGFAGLIERFLSTAEYAKQTMTVFVPSTVFLDQPQNGFNEYIAAKASLEALIRQLSAKYSQWVFHAPRLPRMLTDQTSGLNVEWAQKTAEIMLDALISTNHSSTK